MGVFSADKYYINQCLVCCTIKQRDDVWFTLSYLWVTIANWPIGGVFIIDCCANWNNKHIRATSTFEISAFSFEYDLCHLNGHHLNECKFPDLQKCFIGWVLTNDTTNVNYAVSKILFIVYRQTGEAGDTGFNMKWWSYAWQSLIYMFELVYFIFYTLGRMTKSYLIYLY